MRWLIRPFHILYVLYAMATFVLLMIPVFIWALLVAPFGKIKGGNMVYAGCKLWADVWFALIFIRHKNIFIEHISKFYIIFLGKLKLAYIFYPTAE